MRILLVEDSQRLQRSLTLGLKQAGYVVDVTGDGRDALWRATSVAYDVIILDIMLPSLDGLGVLKELRLAGKDTHVLLLTARDMHSSWHKLQSESSQNPLLLRYLVRELTPLFAAILSLAPRKR